MDGGKSIASRGQINWYGGDFMNRKFVPEDNSSYISYKIFKKEQPAKPEDKEELIDWIDEI